MKTLSTIEISRLINIDHRDIMRSVRHLEKQDVLLRPQYRVSVDIDSVGVQTRVQEYRLDKADSIVLVAAIAPKKTIEVINRWQVIEETVTADVPYHIRCYISNALNVPKGYFAILPDLVDRLIFPVDRLGYVVQDYAVPDISFGRMFCKELERLGYDSELLERYRHSFPNGRVLYPVAYPNDHHSFAVKFLDDVWMPTQADRYMKVDSQESLYAIENAFISSVENAPF